MKLPLSPGGYMFITGLIYFIAGIVNLFWHRFAPIEYIQAVWICVLALPLIVPMRRIVRIGPLWRM